MDNILLDLRDSKIFVEDSLLIDKKISLVFGKNGTGKSTLASLFQEQAEIYDIRCFQGFDGIVGEDKKLNAVILGVQNNEIDRKIQSNEIKIIQRENSIKELQKETLRSEENPDNLWGTVNNKEAAYKAQQDKLSSFYTRSASNIKNLSDPQIALPSYNKKSFQEEISKANLLEDEEVEKHKKIINMDVKSARKIHYKEFNFEALLDSTNGLLIKKVQEKEVISEISGNIAKTEFAERGLGLHEVNDKCSFCGNVITKERFQKLKTYFSADEVQGFKSELNEHVRLIQYEIKQVEEITLDSNNFYPEYTEKLNEIKNNFELKKTKVLFFLNQLRDTCDDKIKDLFKESPKSKINLPDSFGDELVQYNELVIKNNDDDLDAKQEKSKTILRYHAIQKHLYDFGYEHEIVIVESLKLEYDSIKSVMENENKKINILRGEIQDLRKIITKLQADTKNERILADEINKTLELYVNFELEYLEDAAEKGHYRVRCKNTGESRNITQLSSGEKNIIAFLYFVQKIDEVDNLKASSSKLVIFDDPMTSNDDTMQYLIIEELNKLIKKFTTLDKIIIMTHNNHFYLNIKYHYGKNEKQYKQNIFLKLISNGIRTSIIRLNNPNEDFKTNYEALWKELEFIYEEAPSDSMLLNPIRRIIETFTNFNLIDKSAMLNHVSGAEKLFNVNSHSIDDFEAELNAKSKQDIMKMMRECFNKENSLSHFNQYWNIDLDSDYT